MSLLLASDLCNLRGSEERILIPDCEVPPVAAPQHQLSRGPNASGSATKGSLSLSLSHTLSRTLGVSRTSTHHRLTLRESGRVCPCEGSPCAHLSGYSGRSNAFWYRSIVNPPRTRRAHGRRPGRPPALRAAGSTSPTAASPPVVIETRAATIRTAYSMGWAAGTFLGGLPPTRPPTLRLRVTESAARCRKRLLLLSFFFKKK